MLEFNNTELVELAREEQHNKMMELFVQFIQYAKSGEAETAIVTALNDQGEKLQSFMKVVSGLKIESPSVVVQPTSVMFNADPVLKIVAELQNSNQRLIDAVKELNETNKADREFIPKYGVLNRLEKILVRIIN